MSLTMLIFTSLLLPAEGVQFYDGSFEAALKEGASAKKPVFIDFYTSW